MDIQEACGVQPTMVQATNCGVNHAPWYGPLWVCTVPSMASGVNHALWCAPWRHECERHGSVIARLNLHEERAAISSAERSRWSAHILLSVHEVTIHREAASRYSPTASCSQEPTPTSITAIAQAIRLPKQSASTLPVFNNPYPCCQTRILLTCLLLDVVPLT